MAANSVGVGAVGQRCQPAAGGDPIGDMLQAAQFLDFIDPVGLALALAAGECVLIAELQQGWSGQAVENLLAQNGITIGLFKMRNGLLISFSVPADQGDRAIEIISEAGLNVARYGEFDI